MSTKSSETLTLSRSSTKSSMPSSGYRRLFAHLVYKRKQKRRILLHSNQSNHLKNQNEYNRFRCHSIKKYKQYARATKSRQAKMRLHSHQLVVQPRPLLSAHTQITSNSDLVDILSSSSDESWKSEDINKPVAPVYMQPCSSDLSSSGSWKSEDITKPAAAAAYMQLVSSEASVSTFDDSDMGSEYESDSSESLISISSCGDLDRETDITDNIKAVNEMIQSSLNKMSQMEGASRHNSVQECTIEEVELLGQMTEVLEFAGKQFTSGQLGSVDFASAECTKRIIKCLVHGLTKTREEIKAFTRR